nr:MAG TPA: hypothetical protein [Bacteriophage sp.]
MLVTATNGGKVKGIIKLLAPSYIVLATVMSDFPQWGIVKRGRLDMWYTAPTKFPIAFTEVYVGVGTIQESATERSSSNFDNAIRLSLDKIEFAKFEHYYIALGKS